MKKIFARLKKIFDKDYGPKNIFHNILFLLIVALMVYRCFSVDIHECKTLEYPRDITYESQYIKQFDAFVKGQLHLDVEADAGLAELENPYDRDARDEAGIHYHWDHAYYEGKYYSYFGIAPIFTVYFPCYLISGEIPNDAYTCRMLAVYAVIFSAFAVRELLLFFCKRIHLYLFLTGVGAFVSVSGVRMALICSDAYYIPVVSALGCSMAFVFFLFGGLREKSSVPRRIFFVLSSAALALTVLSRPTAALMCASLLPVCLVYVIREKQEKKKTVYDVCAFALPVSLFASAVMWYNYARFGSVLDFGSAYQLTVADISKNKPDTGFAFSALFSYFLHPMWENQVGPGITLSGQLVMPPEARYVYGDSYVGAFAMGLPAAVLLCGRYGRLDTGGAKVYKLCAVYSVCAMSLAVAFFDFCYAGVNMRYIYDIVPMLSLAGCAVLTDMHGIYKGKKKLLFTAVCILFFIAAFAASDIIEKFFISRM